MRMAPLYQPRQVKIAGVERNESTGGNHGERTMETQEIKWECYPRVRDHPAARSFVERLALKGKRPKTVDAYARAIEDLLTHFVNQPPTSLIEADEADLDGDRKSTRLNSSHT